MTVPTTSIDQDIRATQETLRSAGAATGDAAARLLGLAADRLASVRVRLEEMKSEAQSAGRATAKATDDYVRRNPWHSTVTAACAGVIVGLLISR